MPMEVGFDAVRGRGAHGFDWLTMSGVGDAVEADGESVRSELVELRGAGMRSPLPLGEG